MDRNKAAYKLHGFGPIYYINLDDKQDRKIFMETQFEKWEIKNYERISAFDGRESDLSEFIVGKYPEGLTTSELGCTLSHLKAIKHWYETSTSPYAIICEDDCLIDNAKYWNFTWQEFIARVPYCWDCLQLAIISTGNISVNIHNRFVNSFSTAIYCINRRYAEKLIHFHCRDNKFKLDQNVKPRLVADDLVYNGGLTFSTPLFLYELRLGSDIHNDHIDVFHKNSYNGILSFWQNEGKELTVDQITHFDPYFNKISSPSPTE
jgi:GR25 family glycosyltransferase involved in LPS biosynthesis